MNKNAEAVIIGGGVMGCSALYHLTRLGMKDVVLLEQKVLASGSTGRSQAILRMHYSNPITSNMAWKSLEMFKSFEEEMGYPSGYVNTGYVVIVGPEDRAALEENVAMQQSLGIETSVVTQEDLLDIAPMLNASDAGGIAYEPQSGYADSYLVTSGFAQRAQEMGARVHMGVEATAINVSGGKVQSVTLSDGATIDTPTVLVAAGPWSAQLVKPLGVDLPLDTLRHQVIMVRRPERSLPSHPIVGDIAQEFSFRPNARDLTLIGVGEDFGTIQGYNEGVDPATVEDSMTKLVHRMPAMAEGYFRGGWSGLFTITPDWHPIMDRVEAVDGLYCSVGFSGHGFKLSPMIGLCMAEMMTQGQASTLDVSPFRLSRFESGDILTSRYRYNVLA